MMTHHHLAFQRAYRFKCNTYNDKHCCSAKGNVVKTCNVLEDDWENCDKRKENCADKKICKVQKFISRIAPLFFLRLLAISTGLY